jgi:hypothetical protein
MAEEPKHIDFMAKHLVIISIKFNPAIFIFSFTTPEKQQEFFDAIKITGNLAQPSGILPIAAAYKANIEEEYKAKMQIIQPIITHLN